MIHTVDTNTEASSPGDIVIDKQKYLDYIGLQGWKRIYYSLLLRLPKDLLYKRFHKNPVVFHYIRKIEQFKLGCLNPTVVVDKDNGLIATFTNLTYTGSSPTPVIKISREPLHLIKEPALFNGLRLPTVALYQRDPRKQQAYAWDNFDPKIANCFTDDILACDHLLSRLSKNSWICLQEGLKQVQTPGATGLYYVQLDPVLVENA